mgnify:CR=1 FL=1
MTGSKIPLIYILGNGYSGSTLLDLLLGSHPNIWTLGEVQHLPEEISKNKLCGCNLPIQSCAFWQSVVSNVPFGDPDYPMDYFDKFPVGNRYLRWDTFRKIFGTVDGNKKKAVDCYNRVNADWFNAIWHEAVKKRGGAIDWLVDSSKNSDRLFWLQQSNTFDLRVIHLIKAPSAFVYSMMKRNLPYTWSKVIRMTGIWVLENWIGKRICTSMMPREHTFILRYEELASRPEATMTRIGNWLGLDFPPEVVHGFRKYENHAVSGNQMRWQEAEISLDEKWRTMLPAAYQRAINIFTMPFRRMFGYE